MRPILPEPGIDLKSDLSLENFNPVILENPVLFKIVQSVKALPSSVNQ